MLVQYADLLHAANAGDDKIMAVLQKAIEIQPQNYQARLNLAVTAMHAKKWAAAIASLSGIKSVKADQAFSLFYNLAVCDYNLRGIEEARANAKRAQQYATTPQDNNRIAEFIAFLDQAQHPAGVLQPATSSSSAPAPVHEDAVTETEKRELRRDEPTIRWPGDLRHVEGIAKYFECKGKSLRIRIDVDSTLMTFDMDDPKSVIVRNGSNGSFNASCGAQKPFRLGVFYIANPTPGPSAGQVKELVF